MARRSPTQLAFPSPKTWGGCRRGAGRKPLGARTGVPHVPRAPHDVRHPVHVTLRRIADAPSLRSARVFPGLRGALSAASHAGFRVVHFSVQIDHVHLVVEADASLRLSRGVQGLAIRCARAVNRCVGRRGAVWSDRFHARALATPREVRHGMVYVLLNYRKHLRVGPGIDPCSSGAWFDGWRRATRTPTAPAVAPPVARPRTWLATIGWRRAGGLIDWHEAPAARR